MKLKSIAFIACSLFLLNVQTSIAQRVGLKAEEVKQAKAEVVLAWESKMKQKLQSVNEQMCVTQDNLNMKYTARIFGDKPVGGRSMWISMHGGGNAPHALNESQWENQKMLYQPAEGVYVCPRAPWDDWDMWFKNPIDTMFEQLIQTMVLYYGVNPDKVYLMGYSAGGDGVWRMAPRMADHWAAASMMAGHPGDVNLLGLRNLPYMIWCGGEDAAYNRNTINAQRGLEMDSLQKSDPEGYIHETHILPGKPHWMDLEDRASLPWMAKYTRNPYPDKIAWCQGDNGRTHFYWIGVPQSETQKGNVIRANIKKNTVNISQCDYSQVTLYLNDEMLNLDKTIKITYKGKTIFKSKVIRTVKDLETSLDERGDTSYCFPVILKVNIPE